MAGGIQIGPSGIVIGASGIVIGPSTDTPCCCAPCLLGFCHICGGGANPTSITITFSGTGTVLDGTWVLPLVDTEECIWELDTMSVSVAAIGNASPAITGGVSGGDPAAYFSGNLPCIRPGVAYPNVHAGGTGTAVFTYAC